MSAFAPELAPLRRRLAHEVTPHPRLVLASVGIGLVEAGLGTLAMLERGPFEKMRPGLILFVGTAGVHPDRVRALPIGSAAVPTRAVLHCQSEHEGDVYLPERLIRTAGCARAAVARLRGLGGHTVDAVACPLGISRRAPRAGVNTPAIENLEAFAVARAAARAHIPFAAVLGISNRIGKNAHAEWKAHGDAAVKSACALVAAFCGVGQ